MSDSAAFDTLNVSTEFDTARTSPSVRLTASPNSEAQQRKGAVSPLTAVETQTTPSHISQLMSAALPAAPLRTRPNLAAIAPHDIAEFTELVLADNDIAIDAYIELFRAKGVSVETIYLTLLAGTARQLGSLWGADECNFCDVSIATWRIQKIMYDLRPAFFAEGASPIPSGYRVLFAPIGSEQHTLGTMMAAEFFRRKGWDVSSVLPTDNVELLDSVAKEHLDVIGISVSSDDALKNLPSTIAALRAASLNKHLCVMVGGWVFSADPALAEKVGADLYTPDVREAILRAEKLVSRAWDVSLDSNHKFTTDSTQTFTQVRV